MNRLVGYKETGFEWIGKMPIDWELSRSGKFFNERSEKVDDVTYPPLSVTMSGIVDQLSDVAKTNDGENRKLAKKDDFVINSRSDRKGSSGISPRDGSVSLINIVLEPHGLDPHFIQHLFKSYYFKEEYFRNGKGIHWDLWTTRWDQLKNINIPVPSIQEQKLISRYLDKKTQQIDSLVEKIQKKIELLKEQRTSMINKYVTNGLDPNVEMKDSGVEWIGEIPKHWKIKKLKYFSSLIDKKGEPEESSVKISPENVIPHTGICSNLFSHQSGKGVMFEAGDILINKLRLYLGKFLLMDCSGYSMGEMIVVRIEKSLCEEYFFYQLFSEKLIKFLDDHSKGVKMPRVSPEAILNNYLPVPPAFEQKKIVSQISKETSKIDFVIEKESKRIKLLKEYEQSIISSVVTGKVRVKEGMI